jgi:transcriptional regulator with XRE-family HTH domain
LSGLFQAIFHNLSLSLVQKWFNKSAKRYKSRARSFNTGPEKGKCATASCSWEGSRLYQSKEELPETLGRLIFKYREQAGLSVTRLAELVGLQNYSSVTDWETDSFVPGGKNFLKLVEVFFGCGVLTRAHQAETMLELACKKGRGYTTIFTDGWFERLVVANNSLTSGSGNKRAGRASPLEGPNDSETATRAGHFSPSSTQPNRRSYLPAFPQKFKGRTPDLDWIKNRLGIGSQGRTTLESLSVVQGWPGIGKSAFLAWLAHDPDIREAFPDGVLWTALGPDPNPLELLASWWKRQDLELSRFTRVEDVIACLRGEFSAKRILFLLDDVWDDKWVKFFLLGGPRAATVISTRLPGVALKLAATPDIHTLPVLSEIEGFELFSAWAPRITRQYRSQCQRLIETIERLPLGIKAAARMLDRAATLDDDVGAFLDELNEGLAVLKLQDQDYLASGLPGDNETFILPTIDFIFGKSTARLPDQLHQAFAHLALFNFKPAVFDLKLIGPTWEEECGITNARSVMGELVERGLVEKVSKNVYQTHALMYYHAKSLFRTHYES